MVDVDLIAQRGSFRLAIQCRLDALWTVVFGPSGSGKTTLLRLIAGLEHPVSGKIQLDGRLLTDTRERIQLRAGKRETGLVAQQSALFPHLPVSANVAYGLASLDRATQKQRVSAMLELVGASHLADRWPRELSGGEAQRISLARALAPMPRLLLLDEPLSALDAAARDQILAKLQAWLLEQKIQTILVTHDAADALATDAEVAILNEGKLAALGPAKTVLAEERQRLLDRLQQQP